MNGRDLEKMAQQNTDWAKTGFSTPQLVEKKEKFSPVSVSIPVVSDSEERGPGLTKQEIGVLRSALYRINSHYFSSCKCAGCEPARLETQKLFHDLDRLIKRHSEN